MPDAVIERLSARVRELEAEVEMLREKTRHRRGTCAACGRRYGLNRQGTMTSHAAPMSDLRGGSWGHCPGSFNPPVEGRP